MLYLHSTSPNFKSIIKENDFYMAGIKSAQKDLEPEGMNERGINTLKALEGLSFDNKHDYVEFFQKDGKVYTKVNGKIDKTKTFEAKDMYGINAQYAIYQYASSNNALLNKPFSDVEKRIQAAQDDSPEAQKRLLRDYKYRLKVYS